MGFKSCHNATTSLGKLGLEEGDSDTVEQVNFNSINCMLIS
ncbi:hypothetical protein T01_15161 [Trichinella spiralis]|uniref:Uncharacterized protein n=1 Tax=Trichinella spiralis TaxID=6334 RepID=A0A0V0Z964_TRISP|nr:hypothetical protein T01_15161 [Trichinella spiralis]